MNAASTLSAHRAPTMHVLEVGHTRRRLRPCGSRRWCQSRRSGCRRALLLAAVLSDSLRDALPRLRRLLGPRLRASPICGARSRPRRCREGSRRGSSFCDTRSRPRRCREGFWRGCGFCSLQRGLLRCSSGCRGCAFWRPGSRLCGRRECISGCCSLRRLRAWRGCCSC